MLPRPCRALVLLNPQSGAGRAVEDFQAVVQPMLAEADIATTVFITGEFASCFLTPSSSIPGILPGCCRSGMGSSKGLIPPTSPWLCQGSFGCDGWDVTGSGGKGCEGTWLYSVELELFTLERTFKIIKFNR